MDCYSLYGQANSFSSSSSTLTTTSKKEKKRSNNGGGGRKAPLKLSTDPQSVAARERRHRISDRFNILRSLVPGGSKMDTASMLDEAIHYVKFLKTQIWLHENMIMFNSMDLLDDHVVPPPPLVDYSPEVLMDGQALMDYCFQGGHEEVEAVSFGDGYFMKYENN